MAEKEQLQDEQYLADSTEREIDLVYASSEQRERERSMLRISGDKLLGRGCISGRLRVDNDDKLKA